MPHFIAECTDNIREQADLPGLFAKVNEALAATGIFPIGGIRSRAHWLDTWQMADGKHDYAFVHMTLKIGAGRSLESREEVGEMLFALIKTHFAALMAYNGSNVGRVSAAPPGNSRIKDTPCSINTPIP